MNVSRVNLALKIGRWTFDSVHSGIFDVHGGFCSSSMQTDSVSAESAAKTFLVVSLRFITRLKWRGAEAQILARQPFLLFIFPFC